MEKREYALLEKLAPTHPDLKSLWDDHILYEKQLEKLESKTFMTPAERQEAGRIKKLKLDGKTKLVALLQHYAPAAEDGR
ncbi:MAG: DUF465 domain-containing protein [Desulfovibrio sp.]|nr:DUF465 domain-containing protein [Desulfovibrio sp.]